MRKSCVCHLNCIEYDNYIALPVLDKVDWRLPVSCSSVPLTKVICRGGPPLLPAAALQGRSS